MARVFHRLSSFSVVLGFPLTFAASALGQTPAAPPPAAPPQAPTPAPAPPPAPKPPAAAPVPAPPPKPPAPAPVTPPPAAAPVAPAPVAPAEPPEAPVPVAPEPAPPPPPLEPPREAAPTLPPPEPPARPVAVPAPPAELAPDTPWYESIELSAFADAYYSLDFNLPKGDRREPVRAFDRHEGFALSWVGLDISKDADPVGGVISLRFGPTADRLASRAVGSRRDSDYAGLEFVKQGFASWRPVSALRIDLGKFDSPYGVEVAEAQYDINYTRGALYWLGQPYFHTGLRVSADLARSFALKFLAVNGWNNTIDNNLGKTFGLQGTFRVPGAGADEDLLSVSLGYLIGPEHDDTATITCPAGTTPDPDEATGCSSQAGATGGTLVADRGSSNTKGLRHFVDLAVIAAPTPAVTLTLNGSLGIDRQRQGNTANFESALWWGVAAAGRYGFTDSIGLGLRGEFFSDHDGYNTGFSDVLDENGNPPEINVLTGTLTFDYSPLEYLKLMVDARVDWSNRQIFPKSVRDMTGMAVSATLGAIVTTN